MSSNLTRRQILKLAAQMAILAPFARVTAEPLPRLVRSFAAPPATQPAPYKLTAADNRLLDEMERMACRYFWEQASPKTGLVKDRARPTLQDQHYIASIAATGFGLTALCIAHKRDFIPRAKIEERVLTTLQFLQSKMYNNHGFFFHFVNMDTAERVWNCEVSSIDTGILLCGVLTCRQFFDSPEIRNLATQIYERTDWAWMLDRGKTLSHGWTPEHGFLPYRWNTYCELMMIYLLGIGSRTHPIPAATWDAWWRPIFEYRGQPYIGSYAPLFVHQYSHAWFDFRGQRDRYANYFENSVVATKAHREFCAAMHRRFHDYSDRVWGVTASDSAQGYAWWGGPPPVGTIDGTLVPAAAAGSLPFLPRETLSDLHAMRARYGGHEWKRYAFQDAFNPLTGWYDSDVIGIDTGIGLLMAENLRSNFVWDTFMKNPEVRSGMQLAGFKPEGAASESLREPAPSPEASA
ncbi:MAG: glucoamylase family protein [Candidatus Acidiferrales bacterium]